MDQATRVGPTFLGSRLPKETLRAGLLLLAAACAAPAAVAAEAAAPFPEGAAARIEEVVRAAVEANPSIRAAGAALDAAKARSRVETSYPDPALTGTWWPEKASENKPETVELMLEQGVPFPGKLGAVGRVRDAVEEAARIALQRTVRDVTLKVRESAVELVYLRAAAGIARGNRELLGRLRAAGETGYAAGKTGLYDALRAQSQESQTLFDERLLAELEATEVARLNSLLSRPPETPVGAIELHAGRPVAASLAEIAQQAASGRQEVLLARAEGKMAQAERRVAAFESLPELMLGAGYMQESALDDMEATSRWQFQLGLTLPVRFGKNAARRAEAGAGEARALAMEREAADMARAEVSENWFRLRNAERLVALYRDALLPQSVASLQLAETWYRAGQGSFSDFVDAGTLWYTFQLALARAGADREKYLARLEALAERPLTGEGAQAAAAVAPSDEAAWRETLRVLESEREALAAEASSPLVAMEVIVPDLRRGLQLAPAAGDDAAAAAALSGGMALADLEILALLRSPLVRAADRSLRAALEQYGQVTALDEVVRSLASATGSLMGEVGGGMGEGTAARFPFPGMLALKGQIVAQDAEAARLDLDRARRDALAEARRLYFGIDYARRAAALLAEIRDLQERTAKAVGSRYESGQGALADLSEAQVELEKVRTELQTVVAEREVLEAQLRALLALPRQTALGDPQGTESVPAAGEPAALVAAALERRQELRRMRAMAARMELMIQMAEKETVPGFALEASLFENQPLLQDGTMAMREPFATGVDASQGVGTPIRAFSGRTAAYVREARERLAALREEIRAEEEATAARVREAWFARDRAAREERLWGGRVAELTRLASETQERAYRAGRATLPEALAAARLARESELEGARRHAESGQAWAALEAAVGGALPPAAEVR